MADDEASGDLHTACTCGDVGVIRFQVQLQIVCDPGRRPRISAVVLVEAPQHSPLGQSRCCCVRAAELSGIVNARTNGEKRLGTYHDVMPLIKEVGRISRKDCRPREAIVGIKHS